MIKLYNSDEQLFTSMGLGALNDATAGTVTEEVNGEFILEMSYPLSGKRYSDIALGRLIFCKPNPYDNPQAFRIYDISEPENGEIDISAEHISYDLNNIVAAPFTGQNPSDTMNDLKTATEFSGYSCPFVLSAKTEPVDGYGAESDWTIPKLEYGITVHDTVRSIIGGRDDSILSTYGGELKFNNFNVTLYQNRGKNRNVSVRYKKNLETFKQTKNNVGMYSAIYPIWTSTNNDKTSSYYHIWVNNEHYYSTHADADNAKNLLNDGYKNNVVVVREMLNNETSYKYKLYYGEYSTLTDVNAVIKEWTNVDESQSLGSKKGESFYVGHDKNFSTKEQAETYISDILEKTGFNGYVYQITASVYEVYTGNYASYSDALDMCEKIISASSGLASEYNTSTVYNYGDYCTRLVNGIYYTYKCGADGTTGEWNPEKWYEDPKPYSNTAYVTSLPISTETGTQVVTIPEKIVPIPNATVGYDKVLLVDFSSDFDSAPAESVLRSYAEKYASYLITDPEVTFDISFVDLQSASIYGNVTELQTVKLCDTVNVYFPSRNVNKTAKCIKTEYNVITDRYNTITISTDNDPKTDSLSSTISNQYTMIKNTPTKEETKSYTNAVIDNAILNATNVITGNQGGTILLRETQDKIPYELLVLDTGDINTAQNVWRFNNSGLGHSSTGYAGKYDLALLRNGSINADMITSGTLSSSVIEAGSITADHISSGYKESVDAAIASSVDISQGQILTKFRETAYGGTNKIINSGGRNGLEHWDVSSGSTIVSESNANTESGFIFRFTSGSMRQTLNDLIPDTDYTLSFLWFSLISNGQFSISIENSSGQIIKTIWSYTGDASQMWSFQSSTFQTPYANVSLVISSTTDFAISDLILTKGSVLSAWSPAPNEVYTQDVIIDKNGVTVENEETQTKTNINSREFAIYNDNNKVLTVNKDVTELQKTIVHGDATLNKFQFVDANNTSGSGVVAYINILD